MRTENNEGKRMEAKMMEVKRVFSTARLAIRRAVIYTSAIETESHVHKGDRRQMK